jgi:TM2 domain-containing membrane protein YozV
VQADYEVRIRDVLPAAEQASVIQALQAVWPVYENEQIDPGQRQQTGIFGKLFDNIPANIPAYAVLAAGLIILFIFFRTFAGLSLTELARTEVARGILTFIFGISTVGIALIVVLAVFLGNGQKDELAERFQRGKDILTVLIGVFGAILGFYFGSEKNTPAPLLTPTVQLLQQATPAAPPTQAPQQATPAAPPAQAPISPGRP